MHIKKSDVPTTQLEINQLTRLPPVEETDAVVLRNYKIARGLMVGLLIAIPVLWTVAAVFYKTKH